MQFNTFLEVASKRKIPQICRLISIANLKSVNLWLNFSSQFFKTFSLCEQTLHTLRLDLHTFPYF